MEGDPTKLGVSRWKGAELLPAWCVVTRDMEPGRERESSQARGECWVGCQTRYHLFFQDSVPLLCPWLPR